MRVLIVVALATLAVSWTVSVVLALLERLCIQPPLDVDAMRRATTPAPERGVVLFNQMWL